MDLLLHSHDEDDFYEGMADLPTVGNTPQEEEERYRGTLWTFWVSLCRSVAGLCRILCTIEFFSKDDLYRISTFMLIWHYLVNSDDVLSSIISIVVDAEEQTRQCLYIQQQDETASTNGKSSMLLFGNETQPQEQSQSSYHDYTYVAHLKIVAWCMALVAVVTLALRRHPHYNGRFNVLGILSSVILLCVEMSIPLVMLLILGIMIYLVQHFFWIIFMSALIFSSLGFLMGRGVFSRSYG